MIFVLLFLLTGHLTAQDEPLPRLTSRFSLNEIDASPIVLRSAVISPDASMIAWNARTGLCLYQIDTAATSCINFPGSARLNALNLYWSPDSQIIALDEDPFRTLRDGDIWLFNVARRQYINRTDDHSNANLIGDEDKPEPLVDFVPTWDQSSDDLYFLRWRPRQSNSLGLYRIRADGGGFLGLNSGTNQILSDSQPEQVMDLTRRVESIHISIYNIQNFALNGSLTISPDGRRVAFLVRGTQLSAPTNGIYLADFLTDEFKLLIPTNRLSGSGLPDWAGEMIGDGQAWAGDDLILTMTNAGFTQSSLNWASYRISTETGAFTPLLDYTSLNNQVSFIARQSSDGLVSTQYGFVTPDASYFLYLQINPNLADAGAVFALPLNADSNAQPQRLSEAVNVEELSGASVQHVSYGMDDKGLHVLMGEHVYTFELSSENT
jgi:hypothetical protein